MDPVPEPDPEPVPEPSESKALVPVVPLERGEISDFFTSK